MQTCAFGALRFCNNVQDKVAQYFATFLIPSPEDVTIGYGLVDFCKPGSPCTLRMRISWQSTELDTYISFCASGEDHLLKVCGDAHEDRYQSCIVSSDEHPYAFFDASFEGFKIFHKARGAL